MPSPSGAGRPRLAPHARLCYDPARRRYVLLTPETVTLLNGTGAEIVKLCDGQRAVAEILAELHARYGSVPDEEVTAFLASLQASRCVELEPARG